MRNRDCDSANDRCNIGYSDTKSTRRKKQITDDYEFLDNYDFMTHLESSGQLRQYRNVSRDEDAAKEINIDLNFMEDPSFFHEMENYDRLNKTLEQELHELDDSMASEELAITRSRKPSSRSGLSKALHRKWNLAAYSIAVIACIVVICYVTHIFIFNGDAYALEPIASNLTAVTDNSPFASKVKSNVIGANKASTKEVKTETKQEIKQKVKPKTTSSSKQATTSTKKDDKANSKKEFADSVFIGNSLVVGLRQSCKMSGATFLACQSLDIGDAFDKAFVVDRINGGKITILEALHRKQYTKVYLLFGINELGWPYSNAFINKYTKFIKKIKKIQPDAVIYVQSIFPVTKECSKTKKVFTKKNVVKRNKLLKKMCASQKIVYLDVYSTLCDKNGYLPKKNSTDGIHLRKASYRDWLEYIRKCASNN